MRNSLSTVVTAITLIGFAFAAYLFIDARFAKCEDLKKVDQRLEYKIQNDVLMGMQQRKWQIEEKYPDVSKAPVPVQQNIKELDSGLLMQRQKVLKLEDR